MFRGQYSAAMFAEGNVVVVLWDFVAMFPHLNLQFAVRCILCGGPTKQDGYSQLRRVFGLKAVILLSAKKYRCSCCPKAGGKATTFDAKHLVVTNRLPVCISALLPAVFTHSGAMDKDMLHHIDHDIMNGTSITAAWTRAVDFAHKQHNAAELQYLSVQAFMQQPGQQTQLDGSGPSGAPEQFPQFGDASLAKQHLSSSQYCSTVWLDRVQDRCYYAQRVMSAVLGRFL